MSSMYGEAYRDITREARDASVDRLSTTADMSQWQTGWKGSPTEEGNWGFTADMTHVSDFFTGVKDSVTSDVDRIDQKLDKNKEVFESLNGDWGDQWESVGNAAASAALDYLNEKLDKIKKAWETSVDIPIMGVVEDCALIGCNYDKIGSTISKGALKYVQKLTGIAGEDWMDFLKEAGGEAVNDILNNPAVVQATADTDLLKGMAVTLDSIATVVEAVGTVWSWVEPVLPYIKIISEACAAFGTGIAESTEDSVKEATAGWQNILSLTMAILRECLKEVKITIPAILADVNIMFSGAINAGYGDNKWLESAFSNSYYQNMLNEATKSIDDLEVNKFMHEWVPEENAIEHYYGKLGNYVDDQMKGQKGWWTGMARASLDYLDNVASIAIENRYNPSVWRNTGNLWNESDKKNFITSNTSGGYSVAINGKDNSLTPDDIDISIKLAGDLKSIQQASLTQYLNKK